MIEKHLDIPTADGAMSAFVVYPEEGGPFPLVLFYMDAPGKPEELHDGGWPASATTWRCPICTAGARATSGWLPRRGADLLPQPDGHGHGHVPLRTQPLKGISRDPARAEKVDIVRGDRRRRLHKASLRYHDANNWPLLREALQALGRADPIGNGKQHLIPSFQPVAGGGYSSARRKNSTSAATAAPQRGQLLTQHTDLPPRKVR